MDIKRLLDSYGITPNKALGQNFLIDDNAIDTITSKAFSRPVLEIGPGLGSVTLSLVKKANKVMAIEIDKLMVDTLSDIMSDVTSEYRIVHSDFLKVNFSTITEYLGDNFDVVANLPYYITTPICIKLLENAAVIDSMTLMMQTEAAQRFFAKPGDRVYGELAVATDYAYDVERILELSPSSYYPQPDINSTVIRLKRKNVDLSIVPELIKTVKITTAMRRKHILNNLKAVMNKDDAMNVIETAKLEPTARAEALNTEEFINLTRAIISIRT